MCATKVLEIMVENFCTYVGERRFVFPGRRGRGVVLQRVEFGRRMPYHSQFRSVHEVFVPVSRSFHVGPVEVRDDLRRKRYSRVNATETIGAAPSIAQRVERFQTGHGVHGVPESNRTTRDDDRSVRRDFRKKVFFSFRLSSCSL